jgi:ABC-type glycerol-3-phosphate transport system permease component
MFVSMALLPNQDPATLAVTHQQPLAAIAVMYVLPPLLLFLVAQRGFIAGISTSGIK